MFDDLNSDEGATQGGVAAMAFYALGIKPLVDELDTKCCGLGSCKQSWYADDSGAVGKLAKIRIWWDTLNALGPKYGYYPNPSKTVLLLKNSDDTHRAGVMFRDSGIQVKTDGQRYLGAALGSNDFKSSFVNEKNLKWVNDVNQSQRSQMKSRKLRSLPILRGFVTDGPSYREPWVTLIIYSLH